MQKIYDFNETIVKALGADVFFYIAVGLILLFFLFSVVMVKVFGKPIVKRAYIIFSVSVTLAEAGLLIPCGTADITYALITAAFSVFLYIPLYYLKQKTVKVKNGQREFIRYIDGEIKKERELNKNKEKNDFERTAYGDDYQIDRLRPQKEKPVEADVDFSHVKNVLSRLSYYDLSPADKKQIRTLKETVAYAENFGYNDDLKSQINDGLGALLKIMSKYKV